MAEPSALIEQPGAGGACSQTCRELFQQPDAAGAHFHTSAFLRVLEDTADHLARRANVLGNVLLCELLR